MRYKILVIDDEPEIVQLEKNRLEKNHYEVISASDGVEGIVKARDEKPDLIVLDVLMPNLDGYSFVKELKTDPDIKRIPVIVLTSRDQLRQLFEIEGLTQDNFMIKPFNGEELVHRVKKILLQAN